MGRGIACVSTADRNEEGARREREEAGSACARAIDREADDDRRGDVEVELEDDLLFFFLGGIFPLLSKSYHWNETKNNTQT
jgi:hypothetical protein